MPDKYVEMKKKHPNTHKQQQMHMQMTKTWREDDH